MRVLVPTTILMLAMALPAMGEAVPKTQTPEIVERPPAASNMPDEVAVPDQARGYQQAAGPCEIAGPCQPCEPCGPCALADRRKPTKARACWARFSAASSVPARTIRIGISALTRSRCSDRVPADSRCLPGLPRSPPRRRC